MLFWVRRPHHQRRGRDRRSHIYVMCLTFSFRVYRGMTLSGRYGFLWLEHTSFVAVVVIEKVHIQNPSEPSFHQMRTHTYTRRFKEEYARASAAGGVCAAVRCNDVVGSRQHMPTKGVEVATSLMKQITPWPARSACQAKPERRLGRSRQTSPSSSLPKQTAT